jgi:hypothetical protein
MNQLKLFDDGPSHTGAYGQHLSHTVDPPTSAQAAAAHAASGRLGANCKLVLEMVRRCEGRTATELWNRATPSEQAVLAERQEVRRRLTDLAHDGLVAQGEPRKRAENVKAEVTWHICI